MRSVQDREEYIRRLERDVRELRSKVVELSALVFTQAAERDRVLDALFGAATVNGGDPHG
jgi:t-SNARE complex subunit (syntaxin)